MQKSEWLILSDKDGLMRIKSVIFDLDGTLIDSMHSWEKADHRLLQKFNITPPPEISEKMKVFSVREAAEYFVSLGVDMEPDEIIKYIETDVSEEYRTSIGLKPYVIELLDVLDKKKIPYCIATANYRKLTDMVLKRCGIYDRFRFIYTCAESGIKKDNPDFFPQVAAQLQTLHEETVVVDDSLHCIQSAVNSGFHTVAVYEETSSYEWDIIRKAAEFSCMDLGEFMKMVENI